MWMSGKSYRIGSRKPVPIHSAFSHTGLKSLASIPAAFSCRKTFVTSKRLSHAIWLIGFLALGSSSAAQAEPVQILADHAPISSNAKAGRLRLAQAQPAPQSPTDAAAPDQQGAPEEPIGNVATLTGVATVTRNDRAIPLQVKDDIYLNDVVQTQASSSLSITFSDATTFRLSANAQVTIDNYVYEEGGASNAGVFDIGKGTIAFVAAAVAKTGNMQITTPTASLGIRGTTGVVDVPERATAATANNVNIKLYPDADGRVGRIEVNDRQGGRLGALTSGASGFAIRPGAAGARFAAVPITISPQQQQRDQGFVRQVHAAQTTGQRIVREQRDFRRANPGRINPNAPRRQPGQTPGRPGQPGSQPGQNRGGQQLQQPGAPNNRAGQQQPGRQPPSQPGQQPAQGARTGQDGRPANPAQPGAAPRPGQNAQPTNGAQPQPGPPRQGTQPTTPAQNGALSPNARPGSPPQPNAQPRPSAAPPLPAGQRILQQRQPPFAPGAARPGLQNRPAARPARPPPKDKKKH